jgi:hypothetical protein
MEPQNPYAAPAGVSETPLAFTPRERMTVPEEITKPIRHGWIAACISGLFTLVFAILAMMGQKIPGVSPWMLLDVAIIAGLGFGIYRKSRVCAVLMLVYFIASKIYMLTQTTSAGSIGMGVVFLYIYFQATRATFAYHAFVREHA